MKQRRARSIPQRWGGTIGLFTAFALHHSAFARRPIRNRIQRVLPSGLERSFSVWIASLMLIGVRACGNCWRASPGSFPAALSWLPSVMQVAGIGITLRSAASGTSVACGKAASELPTPNAKRPNAAGTLGRWTQPSRSKAPTAGPAT